MDPEMWWTKLPNDTLIETAWERQMNVSGMESYEKSRIGKNDKNRNTTDLATGQKYIRRLLDKASASIETMQRSLVTDARAERNLRGTALIVPADTCALLTLKPLIDRTYCTSNPTTGVVLQSVVTEVAKAVELELNFRHWVQQSKEAATEYAKVNGLSGVPRSQAERLIQDHGVSRQSLTRWRKTFEELSQYKWNTLEKHYCGDALVKAVVDGLPDYFELGLVRVGVRTPKMVRMSDKFRNDFNRMEFHIASVQVVKKPMITRPRKWERTSDD